MRGLGWDTTDLDEVLPEYRHKSRHNPVDYALLIQRVPRLFVEAKALDTNLDDHKWKTQAVNYANAAGVEWCVLTDGDQYCIYNSHAPVDVDEKLFRSVSASDEDQEAHVLATLELLAKDKLGGSILDDLWKAYFVDTHVQAAIAAIFEDEDDGLVRAIRRRTPDLKPAEIRSSLRRADVIVDFPAIPDVEPVPVEKVVKPKPPAVRKRQKRVSVSDLLAAGLVRAGARWQGKTGGQDVFAEVTAEGGLVVDGEALSSPSAAAKKATGYPVDGWHFWKFTDAEGLVREVDELRKRLRERQAVEVEG